jgi:hypothetical protein
MFFETLVELLSAGVATEGPLAVIRHSDHDQGIHFLTAHEFTFTVSVLRFKIISVRKDLSENRFIFPNQYLSSALTTKPLFCEYFLCVWYLNNLQHIAVQSVHLSPSMTTFKCQSDEHEQQDDQPRRQKNIC